MLSCSVQNFEMIWQLNNKELAEEISRDLNWGWVSESGCLVLKQTLPVRLVTWRRSRQSQLHPPPSWRRSYSAFSASWQSFRLRPFGTQTISNRISYHNSVTAGCLPTASLMICYWICECSAMMITITSHTMRQNVSWNLTSPAACKIR